MDSALSIIAERLINEAIREGKLDTSKFHGKPLQLEDNSFVPEDLKMAYKILKNSGYLPPEIEAKKEIQKIEELLADTEDERLRVKQLKKLNFLKLKLNTLRKRPLNLDKFKAYQQRVVEKLSVAEPSSTKQNPSGR